MRSEKYGMNTDRRAGTSADAHVLMERLFSTVLKRAWTSGQHVRIVSQGRLKSVHAGVFCSAACWKVVFCFFHGGYRVHLNLI